MSKPDHRNPQPTVRVKLYEHQQNAMNVVMQHFSALIGGDAPISMAGAGYALLMEM